MDCCIQRPGAAVIASEYEWVSIGRYVLPDAVPIIILWPFSPIRFVCELADTGPLINRVFCGHLGGCVARGRVEDESGWPDRRSLGKHEMEIEAESVAYVVAFRAGVIARSAEYLKSHAQKADMDKIDVDLIVRARPR